MMRWGFGTSLCLLLFSSISSFALETVKANDSPHTPPYHDTVIHHPSASLSIAGDPKLQSSIDQLVRALHSTPDKDTKKTQVGAKVDRKLYYGEPEGVPSPITISSQSISIKANKTKQRSRGIINTDGVRVIEGVRVPDDEADKYYTWRNARVIKGFLVPKNVAPNPHRKRQVVIHTDPQAYLAAAAAAQAQGAPTILDERMRAAPMQMHSYLNGKSQGVSQDLLSSSSQAQAQPVQQQYQYQLIPPHQSSQSQSQSGKTTILPQQTAPQSQQQQGQAYIITDAIKDAHSFVRLSPSPAQVQQQVNQVSGSPISQTQSSSQQRRDEATSSSSSSSASDIQSANHLLLQTLAKHLAQSQTQGGRPLQDAHVQALFQQLYPNSGAVYSVPTISATSLPSQPQVVTLVAGAQQQGSAGVSFSERVGSPQQQQQSQFAVQPQTFITGPGGQTFTVPIPVPSTHSNSDSQHQQHPWKRTGFGPGGAKTHKPHHSSSNFERVMEAIQGGRKTLERMDTTTAVVPALASTGIFLGLSALAAGWYLSKANREVGIVRRTGRPGRSRRDVGPASEVDQATFFQNIIQQSLEKTQQLYEGQADPAFNNAPQGEAMYPREPEREQGKHPRFQHNQRPQNRGDSDDYSHKSRPQYAQEKSGALTIGSSKNFAKVFIPALVLGLSVISITVLIFGWYITGANREIAFLEPAQHSRKKRSLFDPTALSDGWLQRTITTLHSNPYDTMPPPTSKSILPHPFQASGTSKTSDLEFKISNTGLTGVLAGGALIAIIALGLATSFSEGSSRQMKNGRSVSQSYSINNHASANLRRVPRHNSNDIGIEEVSPHSPSFLASVLSSIEDAGTSAFTKLSDFNPSSSPCSKRLVCELLASQEDDTTLRTVEKRTVTLLQMLPNSVSTQLQEAFGDIVASVQRKDCSKFTCGRSSVGVGSHTVQPWRS